MFLKIFEVSFPVQNKSVGKTKYDWITQGIKISCRHKRVVIKDAKRQHYLGV
jgi:hypothetical protein